MAPRSDGPPPDPDPERWDRLEAEFHRLASCPPSERAAALRDLARTDPAAAPGLGGLVASALDSEHPHSVGPFPILRRLGEGRMGVIYEAE